MVTSVLLKKRMQTRKMRHGMLGREEGAIDFGHELSSRICIEAKWQVELRAANKEAIIVSVLNPKLVLITCNGNDG